jgi:hypothetical protein
MSNLGSWCVTCTHDMQQPPVAAQILTKSNSKSDLGLDKMALVSKEKSSLLYLALALRHTPNTLAYQSSTVIRGTSTKLLW